MRFLALALVAGCHAWLGDAPLPTGVTRTAHAVRDILTAPLLYVDEVCERLSRASSCARAPALRYARRHSLGCP